MIVGWWRWSRWWWLIVVLLLIVVIMITVIVMQLIKKEWWWRRKGKRVMNGLRGEEDSGTVSLAKVTQQQELLIQFFIVLAIVHAVATTVVLVVLLGRCCCWRWAFGVVTPLLKLLIGWSGGVNGQEMAGEFRGGCCCCRFFFLLLLLLKLVHHPHTLPSRFLMMVCVILVIEPFGIWREKRKRAANLSVYPFFCVRSCELVSSITFTPCPGTLSVRAREGQPPSVDKTDK